MVGIVLGILFVLGMSAASAANVKTCQNSVNAKLIGSTHPIQEDPDISGNIVVYRKTTYPGGGWSMDLPTSSIVYWKNLKTGTTARITTSTAKQWSPAVSGPRVVWKEGSGITGKYSLYVKNLLTGAKGKLTSSCDSLSPDISGTRVLWCEDRSGKEYVYVKNLVTGTKTLVTVNDVISTPKISGTRVVWTVFKDYGTYLHVKNIATGSTGRIRSKEPYNPDIDGTKIVWGDNNIIYWKDIATGAKGIVGNGMRPTISGNWVACEVQIGSYLKIYAKNIVTGTTVKINQQIGGQFGFNTVISGHRVVWQDWKPYLFVDYWKNVLTGAWGRVQN